MRVAIRADASTRIGTGHVMRCLTLAQGLREVGNNCVFIQRAHVGNLVQFVRDQGFDVIALPEPAVLPESTKDGDYAAWLGVSQDEDAEQTITRIQEIRPDWLILDHYGLDQCWESKLVPHVKKILAIDDIANRQHTCHVLLDQNFGSNEAKYQDQVMTGCKILAGSDFALLRSDFRRWREKSLSRREGNACIRNIFVSMGGVDSKNYTGKVIEQLIKSNLSSGVVLTVVMGATAPHIDSVRRIASALPFKADVKVNVQNIAELMCDADLAIGASGATSWERCCLGLPTIQMVVAENQRQIANALAVYRAVKLIDRIEEIPDLVNSATDWLIETSKMSAKVVDGFGVQRVVDILTDENNRTQ